MKTFQRFLWFVGGFDATLLSEDGCQPVRAKYSSIGGLVLMTGVLAMCSGGFAIYTVFDRVEAALPIAALWGLFISLLDRYLVGSHRKLATVDEYYTSLQKTPPYVGPRSWSNAQALSVRIILAAAIGVVVAVPIEMALLEPWVLEENIRRDDEELKSLLAAANLEAIDADINRSRTTLDARGRETERLRDRVGGELDGTSGTRIFGDGPVARALKQLLEQAQEGQTKARDDLLSKEDQKQKAYQKALVDAKARQELRAGKRSVISDLWSIHDIQARGGSKAELVRIVSWFLTLLFVVIEMTPVLAKAISPFDPYDAALIRQEHPAILDSLAEARRKHAAIHAELSNI